jgi:hypothetical protein
MDSSLEHDQLIRFLLAAKRCTYAAGGTASSTVVAPALPGSHQLEFREGELFYRDVYFGEAHFAGQETVYAGPTPIWSMVYSGGFTEKVTELAEAGEIGQTLQAALREVPPGLPYRGPARFTQGAYTYLNRVQGGLDWFYGDEAILRGEEEVYRLNYSGGRLGLMSQFNP